MKETPGKCDGRLEVLQPPQQFHVPQKKSKYTGSQKLYLQFWWNRPLMKKDMKVKCFFLERHAFKNISEDQTGHSFQPTIKIAMLVLGKALQNWRIFEFAKISDTKKDNISDTKITKKTR